MTITPRPTPATRDDVTAALDAVARGDDGAAERLLGLVYADLRATAKRFAAREAAGRTLQPTALVHEAWLRLAGDGAPRFESRAHFFGAAAAAMRRLLVEAARRRRRLKRGGAGERVTLGGVEAESGPADVDLLDLDDALTRLEERDPRAAKIVSLRWLAGLSVEETASALALSEPTVKREWRFAKAWLKNALER
jgi:RNA polymerase sigma factor (TIGR02999 family)